MFFIGKKEKKIIKNFLREDFNWYYLKRWTMRVRKLLLSKANQTPEVFKLVTKNKSYKLLITHPEGSKQIKKIKKIYHQVKDLNFTPKILFEKEYFFISEFLEGEFADFNNNQFESNLGIMLAKLHSINKKEISKIQVFTQVEQFINNLQEIVKFDHNLLQELKDEMPSNFYTGLTYGDHNIDNYLWEKGDLKLIDFGSFVDGDIIDIHLCSSLFFRKMNLEKFKTSYLENGGTDFIFKNKDILKKIAILRSASYNFDRNKHCPQYDWRQVNDRIINVENVLIRDDYFKSKIIEETLKSYYFPNNLFRIKKHQKYIAKINY